MSMADTSGRGLTSTTSLVQVEGLTVDFWQRDGWVNVVNHVSFIVRPGESLGLVGESGCGKTTTAYSLLGYRRPNSRVRDSRILFQDRDLLQLNRSELQRLRGAQISLVPQDPNIALSPGMPVGEQIIEVLQAHQVCRNRQEARERMLGLLVQVQLPQPSLLARKYPYQLSGGQQQRVLIGMALACDPQLVVLDEPTTGLDVTTQAQILELLRRLRAERGMAIVYVTHNLGVVASICDRLAVMYAGELVEEGATAELFREPRHPYTRGLIACVLRITTAQLGRSSCLHGVLQREQLPPGCPFAPRCDFAEQRCFASPQVLTQVSPSHQVACWRWRELPTLLSAKEEPVTISSWQPQVVASSAEATSLPTAACMCMEVKRLECAYEFDRGWWFLRGWPRPVVRDVSFAIERGEIFALVGQSGSGKSTIARAITGLLIPNGGRITFNGRDITGSVQQRSNELRRQLQLVLQNPGASLNPRQRVSRIVGRPLELFFGLSGAQLRQRVEQLLDDVCLDRSYASRFPDELSGGERQRVAIARALAAEPTLLLCDEILSALDVSVQADILDLLRALQSKNEMTYLFISHDLAVVRSLAHRVGVLYQGELCEVGLVEEVFSPPFHCYTETLLSAVPTIGPERVVSPLVGAESGPAEEKQGTTCPFAPCCPRKICPVCEEVLPPWQFASATHAVRCHIPLAELKKLGRPTSEVVPTRAASETTRASGDPREL